MSPYSQWPSYSSLVQPELVRNVEILAGLQLPPDNSSSAPSNSIERYVGDAISTGAIVTHDTRNLGTHRPLGLQGDIAYSNQGSKYQHSLPESLSSGNNGSYYPFQSPTESSSGSLEEDGHRRQSSLSPSPEFFMSRASDLDGRVDPSLAPPSGYVCPKLVHISNGDVQSQEGHTDFMDEEENDYGCQQTMPMMFHSYCDRPYYYDQPPPLMEPYTQQHDHSPKHDHSCSSGQGSRQNSPTRALKLKTSKNRRNKCPPGMMKPFAASPGEGEKPRKARGGEKPRGRGAGKKPKERKVCREHPGKVFNHASDFKYEPPPLQPSFTIRQWANHSSHGHQKTHEPAAPSTIPLCILLRGLRANIRQQKRVEASRKQPTSPIILLALRRCFVRRQEGHLQPKRPFRSAPQTYAPGSRGQQIFHDKLHGRSDRALPHRASSAATGEQVRLLQATVFGGPRLGTEDGTCRPALRKEQLQGYLTRPLGSR